MSIQVDERKAAGVLTVRVSGKLEKEDYLIFVPEFERLLKEHGKIRVLFEMIDFRGWRPGALWSDIQFSFKHFSDIERLAMVGDKKWEKGMSIFCKPFTTAEIRYFDRAHLREAKAWLESHDEEEQDRGRGSTPPLGPA